MEARIKNFRRGRHTQTMNHMIIYPDSSDSKETASKLVGKEIVWKSPAGKEIKGKVAASHGNKGAVRAIFETGMPGQSIGQKVIIN
jgi:large subunit ribosomal protein L35Ae